MDIPFTLTVTGGPPVEDPFLATIDPAVREVPAGTDAAYTVTATPVGEFAGLIQLEVVGLPEGAMATFTQNPMAVTDSVAVTITTAGVVPGTYPLVLKAVVAGTPPLFGRRR